MTSTNDSVTFSASEHLLGRVKWFNNKSGYGFITITDGPRSGSDIFVHHSAVNVENQQYKYLVQGEYVEFETCSSTSGKHEWQATNVSGIRGGKLMCETKRDLKMARTEYKTHRVVDEPETAEPKTPRQRVPNKDVESSSKKKTVAPRVRGEGPRDGEKKEWTLVGTSEQKPRVRKNAKTTSQ
jgi:CspA family cold shock protein